MAAKCVISVSTCHRMLICTEHKVQLCLMGINIIKDLLIYPKMDINVPTTVHRAEKKQQNAIKICPWGGTNVQKMYFYPSSC